MRVHGGVDLPAMLNLPDLVGIALGNQPQQNVQALGLGPGRQGRLGRGGRGRGGGGHFGCGGPAPGRFRARARRMNARRNRQNFLKKKTKEHRSQSFRWQAMASNASGRNRTMDHMLPLQPGDEDRPKPKGQGAWKQWTPEAVLRAAFGEATATVRQSAREVDGASAGHVIKSRMFVAQCILDCQKNHIQSERTRLRETGMLYHILNMMFDETELEVTLNEVGAASWSVLASHSQLSIHAQGQDMEVDIARPPRALPRKTASCMWGALCQDEGGLRPGFLGSDAKFSAVLVSCDQHAANIRLLKHLHAVVPPHVFVFPSLCAQHRNGNVIERATKHLGILPGSFCVAKSTCRGKFLMDLKQAVRKVLAEKLVLMNAEPPGVQAERAVARRQAKSFLQMMLQCEDETPHAKRSRTKFVDDFVSFFPGPWTGPAWALRQFSGLVVGKLII